MGRDLGQDTGLSWVVQDSPQLGEAFHRRKRPVWVSWQLNETYIRIVKQDHRGVKRVTHPMLGCKSFQAAPATLVGVELMHMLRKGRWWSRLETRAALRPNSSTLWPHKHPTAQG
jgi:transposase-like protein